MPSAPSRPTPRAGPPRPAGWRSRRRWRSRCARCARPAGSSQRAMSAVSSTSAPPSGAASGRIDCAAAQIASTTGIGGTPRARIARRGELTVPDDREVPAARAVGAGGDQFVDGDQGVQSLAPPDGVDRGGRVVAQPRGGLVLAALRPASPMWASAARSAESSAPAMRSAARAGAGGVRGGGRRPRSAGHGDSSSSGQDGPCSAERANRVVQVRTPVKRASSAAVSTASARTRNGPIARRAWAPARPRTAGRPRRSAPPTTTGAETWSGGCTAERARRAAAARGRPPPARARTRRGRPAWSATPSPSSGCAGPLPLKYWPTRRRRSTAVPT